MTQKAVAVQNAAAASSAVPLGRIQRQCACGTHTPGGGDCESCDAEKRPLQRRSDGTRATAGGIPPEVGAALRAPGHPLDTVTRAFMERGFANDFTALPVHPKARAEIGPADDEFESQARAQADATMAAAANRPHNSQRIHDFSAVRIHTGPLASAAARSVGADAFTLGRSVVFAEGRYAPQTREGRHLIAHELTHVMQQGAAGGKIQRATAGEKFLRGLRDFFFAPISIFTDINYGDDELQEYLADITQKNEISGGLYGDDKARQVVKRWKAGVTAFALSPTQKGLLVHEMYSGIVRDGDREGIMTILENSQAVLSGVIAASTIGLGDLVNEMGSGDFLRRMSEIYILLPQMHDEKADKKVAEAYAKNNFPGDAKAERVVEDILAVHSGLSFEDAAEFKAEVAKRLSISTGMVKSQDPASGGQAFDYPSALTPDCPGYVKPAPGQQSDSRNARVNKAARAYWTDVQFVNALSYYFLLTPEGKKHPFQALQTLFQPQTSVCDKTLIHCDYLVNVLQFRAHAEQLGEEQFDKYVQSGRINMTLTYSGFYPDNGFDPKSVKAQGYQSMRPASKADLIIGDHVTFTNHLAFDALNLVGNDWHLENAILTDKNEKGEDLFQGHGSVRGADGRGQTEHEMLVEMGGAFNILAGEALNLARAGKSDDTKVTELQTKYPQVHPKDAKKGEWVVVDPGIYGNTVRRGRQYPLQPANIADPENDPYLPGLFDPNDLSRKTLYPVDRPVEICAGKGATTMTREVRQSIQNNAIKYSINKALDKSRILMKQ